MGVLFHLYIDDLGIINFFWTAAKRVESRPALPAKLQQAVHDLLPQMVIRSNRFEPRGIANLVWSVAKLAEHQQPTTAFIQPDCAGSVTRDDPPSQSV